MPPYKEMRTLIFYLKLFWLGTVALEKLVWFNVFDLARTSKDKAALLASTSQWKLYSWMVKKSRYVLSSRNDLSIVLQSFNTFSRPLFRLTTILLPTKISRTTTLSWVDSFLCADVQKYKRYLLLYIQIKIILVLCWYSLFYLHFVEISKLYTLKNFTIN